VKTLENVTQGIRFEYAGGSFITARPVDALRTSVPSAMINVPDWVVREKITQEVFQILCILYVDGLI